MQVHVDVNALLSLIDKDLFDPDLLFSIETDAKKDLKNLRKEYKKAPNTHEILSALIDDIYKMSQLYVPVDTGYLKNHVRITKKPTEYSIIYESSYAVYVHEIINRSSGKHVEHTEPTRAKFLDDAVIETLQTNKDFLIENSANFSIYTVIDEEAGGKGYYGVVLLPYVKKLRKGRGIAWQKLI